MINIKYTDPKDPFEWYFVVIWIGSQKPKHTSDIQVWAVILVRHSQLYKKNSALWSHGTIDALHAMYSGKDPDDVISLG